MDILLHGVVMYLLLALIVTACALIIYFIACALLFVCDHVYDLFEWIKGFFKR